MSSIRIRIGAGDATDYHFDDDARLGSFLRNFADTAARGEAGVWLGGREAIVWLPSSTPFVARFDGAVPEDLAAILNGRD